MVPAIGMVRKRYDPAQTEIAPEYVVKSAKTADDFEARRFAEHLYYQLEGGAHRGESVKSPTFKHVFEQWKKSLGRSGGIILRASTRARGLRSGRGSWRATTRPPPSRKVINRSGSSISSRATRFRSSAEFGV